MEKKLISIIIPVYNVKDYLEDCLNSIINQTYKNLEIILVDDGSMDGSSDICDKFAQLDTSIMVIHQTNAGAAAARKKGVMYASGFYICFVDADDRIDSKMIEFLVEHIEGNDLITSGCYCELFSGELWIRTDAFDSGNYDTKEKMEYFIANMIAFHNRFEDGILPFLVNKMYRSDILKDVITSIHLNISYAEDRDLLFRYILKCKSIRVTHESFYYYRYRSNSAVRSVNRNFMSDLNNLYLSLSKVFEEHPQKQALIHQLQLFILSRTYQISWYMGFDSSAQTIRYIFPFSDLEDKSNIILYGAGRVGMDYYRQISKNPNIHLVIWVDKHWDKYRDVNTSVHPVEKIQSCSYDYIIVAVNRNDLYEEICRELEENGIPKDKILWKKPIHFAV